MFYCLIKGKEKTDVVYIPNDKLSYRYIERRG